ncbi:MAG: glycosyltransferase family 2 protein [Bacteroidales bacterium]|nr:glycosyltransferase family 2 protein [Bacteroidales bacterium]
MKFKVSVIIPFFNSERFISRAIQSCLRLSEVGEIICIDDGSSDNSYSIVDNIQKSHSKIVLLQHPDKKNHGRSASRNLGIRNAKFDFVAFLDSDDEYTECRFENEKKMFENDNSIDGIYGIVETKFETPQSKTEFEKRFDSNIIKIDTETQPELLYKKLLLGGHGFFQTNTLTVRKSIFTKTGLFDEQFVVMQDTHMWIRMAAKCKLVSNQNNKPIAFYHIHTTNSVIKCDDLRNKLQVELGYSLFKWALKQKEFPYDKKNDFFIGYKIGYPNESDFRTLVRFLWCNPRFLFHRYTLRKIVQIIKGK